MRTPTSEGRTADLGKQVCAVSHTKKQKNTMAMGNDSNCKTNQPKVTFSNRLTGATKSGRVTPGGRDSFALCRNEEQGADAETLKNWRPEASDVPQREVCYNEAPTG
jgi:hypothetical protein